MLRLPNFKLIAPRTMDEALAARQAAGNDAVFVAGGTDLYPNMKRRQQTPSVVISLSRLPGLNDIIARDDGGFDIGACVTLSQLASDQRIRDAYPSVADAAALVSTPLLRNMSTIGGNLLIDTRCNYYNQSYEWRESINFCMKRDGEICWVAPSSPRCWAVQSSDGAPVAVAIGASVTLVSPRGQRTIPAASLYNNDGIQHLNRAADELLTTYHLPGNLNAAAGKRRNCYLKLRRRGAFDFPVVSVAAAVMFDAQSHVKEAQIVLGAVASYPMPATAAVEALIGRPLDEQSIADAADAAFKPAKPMDNTDFTLAWRKEMVRVHVARALQQLAT